jgi:TolB-like protein
MSLIAELRRRNVIRMAGLYVVGAWLIVQVAETVLPAFDVPGWVLRATIILLAIGFLPALMFSWVFELTPDGLKRDADVDPAQSIAPQTAQRMDRLIFAGVIVLIGLIAADRFWPHRASPPVPPEQEARTSEVSAPPIATPATAATQAADRRSIAVLPFVNMSSDPENEHFADGMSEELMNILAGIDGLRVASRTSAFAFKGKDTPIPEIARQLDVHHVLEGSVRKQGNRVRITAQLIEAGSDAYLWTHTYQRDLEDIFLVQEEIAGAITTALRDILGVREVKVDAPTTDMAAYQRYLQGRSRFYRRSELDEAIEDLRFAVESDPGFAEAWASLAAVYNVLGSSSLKSRNDPAQMARLAGLAADRAIALKPHIPIALAVKGQIVAGSDVPGRIAKSIDLLERAAAMSGPDTTPTLWLALTWLTLGHVARALPLLLNAQQADPMVGINNGYLGLAHAIEGREAQAHALILDSLMLSGSGFWTSALALDRVHAGDMAGASDLYMATLPIVEGRYESQRVRTARMLDLLQMPSGRQDILDALAQAEQDPEFSIHASLMFGKGDLAFELVEQRKAHAYFITMYAWLPSMQWLREDPRYFRLMQQKGYVEYWVAHGYPRGCHPVEGSNGRHLSCPVQP